MASLGPSSSHSMQLLRRSSSACICGRDKDLQETLPTDGRVAEYAEGRGAPRLPRCREQVALWRSCLALARCKP